MKFVNFANASSRPAGDSSPAPYGRKAKIGVAPSAPLPPPLNPHTNLKELFKVMKPEPKGLLESKMLRGSRVATVDEVKKETEDILAVLRNLYKK